MKKFFSILLACSMVVLTNCRKPFDEPPGEPVNVNIKSNTTIAALKAMHKVAGTFDNITTDITVEGVVTMDDQSGNYYKTIVFQDATAGIEFKLDGTGLFNDYPVGRKIYVNCNGLTLGDYNGVTQLGAGTFVNASGIESLSGITTILQPTYITKGGVNQPITPKLVKISELNPSLVSTLIKIENIQFATLAIGKTYADAKTKTTTNLAVETCDGGAALVRTSGYANFASTAVPDKNGSIVGIYSVFKADKQIYIRDPSDVAMTAVRCNGTGGGPTGGTVSGDLMTIGDLRKVFTGTLTNAPANKKIAGVIISDKDNGNTTGKNAVIQGADGKGIAIRFDANNPYPVGESVEIEVSGVELSEYNGLLQLNNQPLAKSASKGKGTLPTPKKLTIGALAADFENNESTLVLIEKAATGGATKFAGTITLNDGTGKLAMYTAAAASFAADVPFANSNIVGVVGQFNTTLQIAMRSKADATDAGGGGTGGTTLTIEPIGTIRALYQGTLLQVPADKGIAGVVISDKDTKNGSALNLVIQGADGKGIVVRFAGNHTFALGESIEINLSGVELSEYNGLLQLNKVPLANAKSKGAGTLPKPTVMTIADYIAGFENVESTLVQIKNATVTGGKYFDATRGTTNSTKGTVKATDATGTIDIYTVTTATFAGDTAPTTTVSVTGVASEFTATGATAKGVQILLRSASDVK